MEDLVNETFLRAYRSLPRFEGRARETTWLHGIAINVARNHVEKTRRRARLDQRFVQDQKPSMVSPPHEGSENAALERLRRALRNLDPPLREAFVLRVLEQRAWKEVSALLDVPISTLHARVARAEAMVRRAIGGES